MAAGMEVAGDGLDAELDVPVGRHRLLREDRLEVVSPQRPRLNQGVVHLQGSYSVVSGHFTAVFFSTPHLIWLKLYAIMIFHRVDAACTA